MSKGILEFNLPEEQDEFEAAQNVQYSLNRIDEVYNVLRKYRKYETLNKIEQKFFEKISDEITNALSE